MRWLLIVLALAGCGNPADNAEEICGRRFSPGTPSFERCYAREYDDQQMQFEMIGNSMVRPMGQPASCMVIGSTVSCR